MMRPWLGFLMLAAVVLAGPSAAQAPAAPAPAAARVALMIGNAFYPGVSNDPGGLRIPNTLNDIQLVGDSLRRAGFSVDTVTNANAAEMRRALGAFDAKARSADAAIVYFAGAGVEIDGVNYFLPVDIRLADLPHPALRRAPC